MNEKKKILVICPHPVGYVPGQRLKYEQYFSHWEQHGYSVEVRPFMSEALQKIIYQKGKTVRKAIGILAGYFRRIRDLFAVHRYDVVYVFLWVSPIGPPIFESILCNRARKIVYDIDDLVFLKNDRAEPWYALLFKGRKKPVYMMKHADHVVTCTPYLDEFARQFNSNTTDISSTINTDTYQPVNTYKNDKKLVLGWSGSHSTIRMLKTIIPALQTLRKQLDFKMLVMGSTDFSVPGIEIECHPWSEEKEIPTLQQMDIGLYPLPTDEEWVKGKSGLKALQYMALGIPTIATNVGCNSRVIENGISGFLVDTQEDWVNKILELAANPGLRKSVGMAGRNRVEQMYSVKANQPVYLSILNQVVANSNRN